MEEPGKCIEAGRKQKSRDVPLEHLKERGGKVDGT